METTHPVDDATPGDRMPSTHEPCVHVRGRVLVLQLARQVRDLCIVTVTEQHIDVGPIRIGRRGYERTVQLDIYLTEHRMQPVIERPYGE